jgi:exodeoxyribonuclease-3
MFNSQGGNYTWWPYAFDARNRNMGWRIDYCFVSKPMAGKLRGGKIFSSAEQFSDHCAVGVEI